MIIAISLRDQFLYKGFTLIELLITLAIITMVTVLGVPAFSKYGEGARFDQKVSEIKYGLEETHLKMLNPENGVKVYSLEALDVGNKVVMKRGVATPDTVYKEILISSKDTITSGKLVCHVETKVCDSSDSVGGPPLDPAGAQIFRIENKNGDNSKTFRIKGDPFGVIIDPGVS